MSSEIVSAAVPRKRYLPWGRILLGTGAIASLWLSPLPTSWALATAAVYIAFGVFGLIAARGGRSYGGVFSLLVLFVDLLFFLVLVSAETGSRAWLPAAAYLFLATEAVVFYNPQEVLIVVGVSAIFCAVVSSPNASLLRRAAIIAGVVAYACSAYKKRLEARMAELVRQAAETRDAAERAREAERQRIASDFHDGPLQNFISLQMRLEILRKLLERDLHTGMDDLRELQNVAQQQVKELRAFVRGMRPLDLQGANLFASTRRVCEDFQKESGIPVTFVGGDAPLKLPEETASEVVQMLREALHNVLKHAGATRVSVSVERAPGSLDISVDDNGRGFQFSGVYTLDELELLRLGPASLKRRARALNSDMTLESRPGRGAGLRLRIPVA